MRLQKFYQVDAFTSKPFTGNPAAVFILKESAERSWMQNVANEMNLAETAFLWPTGNDSFHLKWFTPTTEVELCGHATLASAFVLFESGLVSQHGKISFETLSGILKAKRVNKQIVLNFPAIKTFEIEAAETLKSAFPTEIKGVAENDLGYLIVEVADPEYIRNYTIDLARLHQLGEKIIILTSEGDSHYDMVSRVFAPAFGIEEDSVTGSAHCALTWYYNQKTGKTRFKGFQASSRTGIVETELEDDRVLLKGEAVTVLEGNLFY